MEKEKRLENGASYFEEALFHSEQTYVHPTAIIGKDVFLDKNVKIGPYCIIVGRVVIESGTRLHTHCTVGFPAQNIGIKESLGTLHIKKNCDIREFATIHASKYPTGSTIIGNNCYLMCYTHVAHDCILEDNVTLINNVQLGGHTVVEKNAIIMGCSATHQFCRIGKFTALAPYSGTRQDLPPFCIFDGRPGGFAGLNLIGLKRAGFTSENIWALKKITSLFYREKQPIERIQQTIQNESWGNDQCVQDFMSFITTSNRGVSRRRATERSSEKNEE
ncbi:MAG: acyl-ACP--UDP-N-acetylglucosamine O-acyltransferase [bacterium]